MELTSKQFDEIKDCHIGSGEMFINMGDCVRQIQFNLGKHGNWYSGKRKLESVLIDFSLEIQEANQ